MAIKFLLVGIVLILQMASLIYWESSWRHFTDGDIGEVWLRSLVAGLGLAFVIVGIVLHCLGE